MDWTGACFLERRPAGGGGAASSRTMSLPASGGAPLPTPGVVRLATPDRLLSQHPRRSRGGAVFSGGAHFVRALGLSSLGPSSPPLVGLCNRLAGLVKKNSLTKIFSKREPWFCVGKIFGRELFPNPPFRVLHSSVRCPFWLKLFCRYSSNCFLSSFSPPSSPFPNGATVVRLPPSFSVCERPVHAPAGLSGLCPFPP